MWDDLDKLHKTLGELEKAFYQVAVHDSQLQAYGLRRLKRWLDLSELTPLFDAFPLELASCKKIIEIYDKGIYDQLTELLRETKLEDLIIRFSVKLKIAENEDSYINPIRVMLSTFRLMFRSRNLASILFPKNNISNNDISMEDVLSAISRIKSLLATVSLELKKRHKSDDEIFKPSNINITHITVEIDAAIVNIDQSEGLNRGERKKLIEYLGVCRIGQVSKAHI